MEKIRDLLKHSKDKAITILRSDTFKTGLTFASLMVAVIAVSWGYVMTVFTNDIKNVVIQKEEEITKLEEQVDYYSGEAARQKMIAEEYYELFISGLWYQDFYYDNVNPYTGEIEGEYYE